MVSTVDNSKKKNEEKDERIWRLKVEILRVSVPTVVLVFILLKPTPNRNPRTCDFFFRTVRASFRETIFVFDQLT